MVNLSDFDGMKEMKVYIPFCEAVDVKTSKYALCWYWKDCV